ncbi:MAG: hypothetical protein V4603_19205 [Pseudomonadota bacterium]
MGPDPLPRFGMTTFGESAPGPAVLKHFGFTADNVAATAEAML